MRAYLFKPALVEIAPESISVGGSWMPPKAHGALTVKFLSEEFSKAECPKLFDIGASTGSFSLLGALHPKLTVVSFEPNPIARTILKLNIHLNGLSDRVQVFPFALSNYDGEGILKVPTQSGAATLGDLKKYKTWEEIPVTVRKIDSLSLGHADFAKIDVEGAELLVLQGGEEFFTSCMPNVLVEFKNTSAAQFGYHPNDILELLKLWGYRNFKKVGWKRADLWATK